MENELHRRTHAQLQKHLVRTNSCKQTASFCYRHTSLNNIDILRTYFHCHSYFCETCAKKKKAKLYKKFKRLKFNGNLRFLTLTLSSKDYTPEQSLEKISSYFNLFVKLLRYRGFKFQYFKIIEFTKNNIAHLHILVNCFLPFNIVKTLWQSITGSSIVYIEKIKSQQSAINYLFKYMQKAISSTSNYLFYLMNKRRYSYSENFFLPAENEIPFIQSRLYFYSEFDIISVVNKYFSLYFSGYGLFKFNLLN